jgi:phosphoglycolate phosphatase
VAQLLLRGKLLGGGCDIKAVLFDKDGTLSISEPQLETLAKSRVFCARRLLLERHPELIAPLVDEFASLLERAYGWSASGIHPAGTTAVASREHNLISTATAMAQIGLGWPEAMDLSEDVFTATDGLQHSRDEFQTCATDGLHDLIQALRAASVDCAVISNDEVAGIEAFLISQKLKQHFQELWSANHSPRKPDPAAVDALCERLHVRPDQCALIGDANSDLVMAESAGVAVVLGYGVGWKQRPPLYPRFPVLEHWRDLTVAVPC